jgi:ABC transporter
VGSRDSREGLKDRTKGALGGKIYTQQQGQDMTPGNSTMDGMSAVRGGDRERGVDSGKDRERGSERSSASFRERGVNFEVYAGDRVLIAGPSGAGKSSLLRAVSGLWELGSGKVIWNTNRNSSRNCRDSRNRPGEIRTPIGVFFLPQKPYNLLGSLRQQIAYPGFCPDDVTLTEECVRDSCPFNTHTHSAATTTAASESDLVLLDILKRVRLGTLAARMGMGDEGAGLGVYKDWSKVICFLFLFFPFKRQAVFLFSAYFPE